jgi:PAS domain S-box-containing protein
MFGYPRDAVEGRVLTEVLVPPEQRELEREKLDETLRVGLATYESVHSRQDGSLVYVDVSSKVVGAETPLVLRAYKDVTAIKLLRDAKFLEDKYLDLLESTPDAILMVNAAGRIVLANSQAEHLFGYTPGELRGQPVETLLPTSLRAAHVGHRSRYFAQPRTRTMGAGLELNGRRKDAVAFPVEISLSPLKTEQGLLVMSAIRDITERRRIERTLHDKNIELQNAAAAKDRFLATMSHELRTPMNAIIGYTGTLLMKLPGPLTKDQERQLTTIQTSAKHLLSLINDLLDLAKIESDKLEVKIEDVDCAAVIEEIAATLRPMADRKRIALEVRLAGKELVLKTDRRALSQIVINLVTNAIKFTEEGGVVISTDRQHADGAPCRVIAVADTGCGIDQDDQKRLFQAFTQLDSSSTRTHEGTGLGLHLSQKLAALIGGRLTCESAPGVGSTFRLALRE